MNYSKADDLLKNKFNGDWKKMLDGLEKWSKEVLQSENNPSEEEKKEDNKENKE